MYLEELSEFYRKRGQGLLGLGCWWLPDSHVLWRHFQKCALAFSLVSMPVPSPARAVFFLRIFFCPLKPNVCAAQAFQSEGSCLQDCLSLCHYYIVIKSAYSFPNPQIRDCFGKLEANVNICKHF